MWSVVDRNVVMRRTPVYSIGFNLRTNHSGNKVKSHYETGKGGLVYGGTVLARIEFELSTVRAVGTLNISGRSVAPFQTREVLEFVVVHRYTPN